MIAPARFLLARLLPVLVAYTPLAAAADPLVELPRDLEIELALSALPEALRADATVYVRDPERGFVVHRRGGNGWMTFVARTSVRFYAADWPYEYPRDQLIPQAHDEVGRAHHVKPYFDLEKMRLAGVPAAEAKRTLRERFGNGTYTAPDRGGMSYMLAPIHRAYRQPAVSDRVETFSFPHHMPYAPHTDAAVLGAMDPHGRAGVLGHGGHDSGPHGYFYFMVQADQAEAIRRNYTELLARLCEQHDNWCLPQRGPEETTR